MENYFADCMNEEQLKARYRELCVRMHPDRNQDNPNATAEFQEMQQQYEERKAELQGDYTKARKGRERREREARERAEKERRERERRKVEMVVEQARLNRQKSFRDYKTGDYVYARQVNTMYGFGKDGKIIIDNNSGEDILRAVLKEGLQDECVVVIETIVECTDFDILNVNPSKLMPDGLWGGWEIIQKADPAQGIHKSKRVAKVVMFRSESYCLYGNPKGDMSIDEYYMPVGYAVIYQTHLDRIKAKVAYEQAEKARIEAEKKARLLAEQQPLIDEWKDRLVEMSRGLSLSERETVAVANLKAVLKGRFPGTTFKMRADRRYGWHMTWEDGPTIREVDDIIELFVPRNMNGELTPWNEHYGTLGFVGIDRKMSVLTKAKILQQLGQVTEAFRECGIDDAVELSDFDWVMLHAMVGVDVNDDTVSKCLNTLHTDGRRTVRAMSAVIYIFQHTSYKKTAKVKKIKAA